MNGSGGNTVKTEALRPVGGQVPEVIYWDFKKTAAERKETMQEALAHALMLYIEFKPEEDKDGLTK